MSDDFVCMCWIYATTTKFHCSVFTEETFKGAGGVVVPRLLAAWFDLEGSKGAGGSPGLPLACQAERGGPGAQAEKPG